MSSPRTILLLGLALALAACSSGGNESKAANDEPEKGTSRPDAPEREPEGEPEPYPEADAGVSAEGPVPLTVWVDDLIEERTSDQAQPDSVDDKQIVDDTTPESFDKYLE